MNFSHWQLRLLSGLSDSQNYSFDFKSLVGLQHYSNMATLLLMKQFQQLEQTPVPHFTVDLPDDEDPFEWEVLLHGPDDTP
eukprot:gene5731-2476_t